MCVRLKEYISEKKDFPHSMLAYGREYLEKWKTYLKIYTDGSKCEEMTACAFYVNEFKFIVTLGYQSIHQCLIQSWWQF